MFFPMASITGFVWRSRTFVSTSGRNVVEISPCNADRSDAPPQNRDRIDSRHSKSIASNLNVEPPQLKQATASWTFYLLSGTQMSTRRTLGFWLGSLTAALVTGVIVWSQLGKSPETLEDEGRRAMARNELAVAIAAFQQAVKISPDRLSAWKLLADAACRDGQIEESCRALKVVTNLAPDDANSLGLQLGGRWMRKNQIQPAIRTLKLAIVASSRPPQPFRLLAQIYSVTGQRREVVRCLTELLKRNDFTRNDLLVLSSVNPTINDPQRLEMILKANPADKSPLMSLAMLELDQNRVAAAKQYLIEITRADPQNAEAQGLLGEVLADFEPDAFLEWNSSLPQEVETAPGVWLARGKWLHARKHPPQAVRCLLEVAKREPENLSACTLLGQLLKSEGQLEQGNEFTERSRRLQRILDLNERIQEPRGSESVRPMIEELEATGRLWEAWGWCVIHLQEQPNDKTGIVTIRDRIATKLKHDVPRTIAESVLAKRMDLNLYPLPDWAKIKADAVSDVTTHQTAISPIHFEDRSSEAGLDFRYVNTKAQVSGHKIYETMGAGVAVLDFDQDGWPDLYLPQGKTLPLDSDTGPGDAICRNLRGQQFRDVTLAANIQETNYSQGVSAGDINNDGFPDVYVANLGRNTLFQNNGDGTFTEITQDAGLQESVWTVSCAIADFNGDSLPELFDVNYVQGTELLTATCLDQNMRPVVCRPTVFDAVMDTLWVNQGDGNFSSLQKDAGLNLPQGMGLGLVIADFNEDSRSDIFIANDMTANYLLMNKTSEPGQAPLFSEEAFQKGVALDMNGLAQACMGVACADVNRDGRPDLFVTNFSRESNTLYLSTHNALYEDQTQQADLREPSFEPLGFGTQFLDADHDGWSDLIVMNGHIDEFVGEPFRMRAQVFSGQSGSRFVELPHEQAGELFQEQRLARGLAKLDWNRDGRTDFVATDLERPVLLAENTTFTQNSFFRLRLTGTVSSRDAIGAKVVIAISEGDERVLQLSAGDGYESCNERSLEVGLGEMKSVARLEIHWPSGATSRYENITADQWLHAIEGQGQLVNVPQ
jgi:tetratricopeptide (TPR) repeat protein